MEITKNKNHGLGYIDFLFLNPYPAVWFPFWKSQTFWRQSCWYLLCMSWPSAIVTGKALISSDAEIFVCDFFPKFEMTKTYSLRAEGKLFKSRNLRNKNIRDTITLIIFSRINDDVYVGLSSVYFSLALSHQVDGSNFLNLCWLTFRWSISFALLVAIPLQS